MTTVTNPEGATMEDSMSPLDWFACACTMVALATLILCASILLTGREPHTDPSHRPECNVYHSGPCHRHVLT